MASPISEDLSTESSIECSHSNSASITGRDCFWRFSYRSSGVLFLISSSTLYRIPIRAIAWYATVSFSCSFVKSFFSAVRSTSKRHLACVFFEFSDKAHTRRKYAETLKTVRDKEKRKGTLAYDALKQIGTIHKLDNELAGVEPVERQHRRQLEMKPLVDAYFA